MARMSGPVLELLLPVDRAANEPLHAQIECRLREAIRDGRLAVGAPVPSSRALAGEAPGGLAGGGQPNTGDHDGGEGVAGNRIGMLSAGGRGRESQQQDAPRASAECGMRNAECQWSLPIASDPSFQFRIPNSAFHIQLNALSPVISWPKMSVCTSCVPSYVYTDSRLARWRIA